MIIENQIIKILIDTQTLHIVMILKRQAIELQFLFTWTYLMEHMSRPKRFRGKNMTQRKLLSELRKSLLDFFTLS